jgi:hypothetical protein
MWAGKRLGIKGRFFGIPCDEGWGPGEFELRERVASEGWGARLLMARDRRDGRGPEITRRVSEAAV